MWLLLEVVRARWHQALPWRWYTMTDDKAKVTEELKGLLRDKDAESARLRAEINRLRQALGQNDKLQASNNQEVQQLQQQLQEALTLNK